MEVYSIAKKFNVKDTENNVAFVQYVQKLHDREITELKNEYEKLRELHYRSGGFLPYHPGSSDNMFLNCLRLDYKEYKNGTISFIQLLRFLWFHAWEIKNDKI